jgi:hypothetical protein
MAEAFVRINKEGLRIGNVELMLSFLAGTLSGELKRRVVQLYQEYEKRDALIQPIIRSVFSNFGLSQTQLAKPKQFKANIERIRKIQPMELDRRIDTSARALQLAFDFIDKEFGLRSARLIPSQTALIPLTTYFAKTGVEKLIDMPVADRDQMTAWFILANLNGHYSSSVDTRLNRDIKTIQDENGFPFFQLQGAMKVRKRITLEWLRDGLERSALREANKAFVFLLYVLLTKNNADDWAGRLVSSRDLKELERHHIFPREYLQRELELDDVEEDPVEAEVIISNLGNITFVLKEVNASINDEPPSDYMKNYIARARLHFIPEDDQLWTREAYESGAFQEARLKLIFEAAQKHFPNVFETDEAAKVQRLAF